MDELTRRVEELQEENARLKEALQVVEEDRNAVEPLPNRPPNVVQDFFPAEDSRATSRPPSPGR